MKDPKIELKDWKRNADGSVRGRCIATWFGASDEPIDYGVINRAQIQMKRLFEKGVESGDTEDPFGNSIIIAVSMGTIDADIRMIMAFLTPPKGQAGSFEDVQTAARTMGALPVQIVPGKRRITLRDEDDHDDSNRDPKGTKAAKPARASARRMATRPRSR